MRKTRQQEVAQKAWELVNHTKLYYHGNRQFEEYIQLLQGAGSMILDCGLGQTIAFYYSKRKLDNITQIKNPQYLILEQFANYLRQNNGNEVEELIVSLMDDSSSYRIKTNQILELLNWMKRFSKGLE